MFFFSGIFDSLKMILFWGDFGVGLVGGGTGTGVWVRRRQGKGKGEGEGEGKVGFGDRIA